MIIDTNPLKEYIRKNHLFPHARNWGIQGPIHDINGGRIPLMPSVFLNLGEGNLVRSGDTRTFILNSESEVVEYGKLGLSYGDSKGRYQKMEVRTEELPTLNDKNRRTTQYMETLLQVLPGSNVLTKHILAHFLGMFMGFSTFKLIQFEEQREILRHLDEESFVTTFIEACCLSGQYFDGDFSDFQGEGLGTQEVIPNEIQGIFG